MPETTTPSARLALVIDDDQGNRTVLSLFLTRCGYQVHTANNGKDGIALANSQPITLAIVDMLLPDMLGSNVVAAVRASRPEAVIVAATMDDNPNTLHAAYDAGCDVFLVKPYDITLVTEVVQKAQRGRRWLADRNGLREYRGW